MAQYDINLRDYLRIVRRRKGIIVLVPLIFALASFALAVVQAPPPIYRATAVVRFERAVSVSGLLQELVSAMPSGSVETQAALIKGFPVTSLAAKKLERIPRTATPEQIRASAAYLRVLDGIQGQISVKTSESTSLIEISAASADPEEAARVANSVAEAFLEDNFETRSRQVREAREFIERQLTEVGTRLRDSEEELKTFKEANRILVFPDETRESLRRLAALEGEQEAVRAAIGETEEHLRLLQTGRAIGRPGGPSADGADTALVKLYGSLSDLTLQRDALLVTLLPTHPQVQQLDAQIQSRRQSLRDALSARLQALRTRAGELQRGIARLRQEQASIPAAEVRMARMEREVKVAERMFSLLKEKHQEAQIREKEQVAEVSPVRPAMVSRQPVNPPQPVPKAAVGLVVGLVMGFILAFVAETLDTSVGAIEDVESLLGSPVLGVIPHLDVKGEVAEETGQAATLDRGTEEKYAFLISLFLPNSRVVEAMRGLRTNILLSGLEPNLRTIMVTSATPGEGKTTVAINLAIVLAQLGKRTLLIEADLRNPFLHHAFGIPREPGLTDVVVGSVALEEATLTFSDFVLGRAGLESLIDRPGLDNLFLLPSGHQPPNPTEFLSAQALSTLLGELRQRYDYVVLDCAPILPVADSTILGSRVDGALLVVRVGSVARAALRRAKTLLEAARTRLLGVCLTGVKAEVSPDYGEMGYYRYRYEAAARRPAGGGRLAALRGDLRGNLRGLVLLLVLLLALAVGLWAWRSGRPRLPFLSGALSDVPQGAVATIPALTPARPAGATSVFAPERPTSERQLATIRVAPRSGPIFVPERPDSERHLATPPEPIGVTRGEAGPMRSPKGERPGFAGRAVGGGQSPPPKISRAPRPSRVFVAELPESDRHLAIAAAPRKPHGVFPAERPTSERQLLLVSMARRSAPAPPPNGSRAGATAAPAQPDATPRLETEANGPVRYAVQLRAVPSAEEAQQAVAAFQGGTAGGAVPVTAVRAPRLRVLAYGFRGAPNGQAGAAGPLWRVLAGAFDTPAEAEALGWGLMRDARIEEFLVVETPARR